MIAIQLITFISYPIITRLYDASQFGLYKIFNSVVAILFAAMPGRFDLAAILTKSNERAFALIDLSLKLLGGYSLFLFAVFLFVDASILQLLNIDIPLEYLLLVPLAVMSLGFIEVFSNLWNRQEKYGKIATVKLVHRILVISFWIIGAYYLLPLNGLIVGLLFGNLIVLIVIYSNSGQSVYFKSKLKYWKKLGAYYRDFLVYSSPNNLLSVIGDQLPLIVIAISFNETLLGFFALAYSLLSISQQLIGGSLGVIVFQKLSALERLKKTGANLMVKTWMFLFLIGIFPCLIIMFYGPEIFDFVLGNAWTEAGGIASILVPLTLVMVMNSATISSNLVYRKQRLDLYFNIIIIFTRSLPFIIGAAYDDIYLALYLYVGLNIFQIISLNYFLWKASRISNS